MNGSTRAELLKGIDELRAYVADLPDNVDWQFRVERALDLREDYQGFVDGSAGAGVTIKLEIAGGARTRRWDAFGNLLEDERCSQ